MTKRRTIEVIVETDELLIVNKRSRAVPLQCPSCGAPLEEMLALANPTASPDKDAQENLRVDAFGRIYRLHE